MKKNWDEWCKNIPVMCIKKNRNPSYQNPEAILYFPWLDGMRWTVVGSANLRQASPVCHQKTPAQSRTGGWTRHKRGRYEPITSRFGKKIEMFCVASPTHPARYNSHWGWN